MMKFIDTHAHLLPDFDDGSPDWDTTLQMLENAEQDGIVELVCTPHILSQKDFDREDEAEALYNQLRHRVKKAGIKINIHLGAELYIQPELNLQRKIATYAGNGRYFLVEFPMNLIPDFVKQHFFDIMMKNQTPVIAHPERNGKIIRDPDTAFEFVEHGALLQVNSGSILGIFGKSARATAIQLIDANLVSLIATDAHDLLSRPLRLRSAFEFVQERWGNEKAQALFYENPQKIILAQDVKVVNAKPPSQVTAKTLSGKIRDFFNSMKN
jgi:protein-tyrosine phosphatase